METRKAKIIRTSPGGTAGRNSAGYRISLPTSWIKELGTNADNMEVELQFDGKAITIRQKQTAEQYISFRKAEGHILKKYLFYNFEDVCTVIYADFTEQSIYAENYTDNLVKTAFGKNQFPLWENFCSFIEERCIPAQRDGIREWLETNGLEEYDPFQIILKTEGRMAEDHQWLRVEDI